MDIDAALDSTLPLVRVPRHKALDEIQVGARRYLMSSNGLWIEARSDVLHARVLLQSFDAGLALPFGRVDQVLESRHGHIPMSINENMRERAALCLPNEWAGVIVHEGSGYRLHEPTPLSASPGRICYRTGGFDNLSVLIDVHSHGTGAAYFSAQDDKDDRANPSPCFYAMVLGSLGEGQDITVAHRLVVNGHFFVKEPGRMWICDHSKNR